MMKLLALLLIVSMFSPYAQEVEFVSPDSLPGSGNFLRSLTNDLRRYFTALRIDSRVDDLQNNCLSLKKNFYPGQAIEETLLCFFVVSESEGALRETVEIYQDNRLVQRLIHFQSGVADGRPSSRESYFNFNFQIRGQSGRFITTGLTNMDYTWVKTEAFEKGHLRFEPVNFSLTLLKEYAETDNRVRYGLSCNFCGGVSWLQVSTLAEDDFHPPRVNYSDSQFPLGTTPRRFNELLGSLVTRPLSQLSRTLQSTLVFEGGLPEVRF